MVLASRLLPGWDCASCTQQVERGCEEDSKVRSYTLDDETSRRCPLRPFLDDENVGRLMHAYNWVQKGFLPNDGTYLDQPTNLIQAISIIDTAIHDAEENKRHEAEMKAQRERRTAAGASPEGRPPKRPMGPRTL